MTRHRIVNGIKVNFTAEEEAQRDAEEAQALIDQQNEEQAISDAEAKKASGKQKLKDLGLTDLEIEALFKPEQGSIE
tara:strand:+ start:238 stop:468 length:231 start_codon:yes stop_codon:yes gene_type:complete